jgi:hypothetical protein
MEARQWDDDTLLDNLRQAIEFAGPLDTAVDTGIAAFTWRTIDDELARASLVFDSLMENTTRAAIDDSARLLVFEADSITLEIEVNPGHITGQVVPPTTGTIELQSPDGVVGRTTIQDFGSFRIEVRTRGPVRLRLHGPHTSTVTDWFSGPH